MDELLNRLEIVQPALLNSESGRDIALLLGYCGVSEQHGGCCSQIAVLDEEAFAHDLENPQFEHYQRGLRFVLDVLTEAIAETSRAGLPADAVPMVFAKAREVFKLINPFCYFSIATPDGDHNRAESDKLFGSLVDMLRDMRPELIGAYAVVRRHVETHSCGATRTSQLPRMQSAAAADAATEDLLTGQSLKLFTALKSLPAGRWMTFSDIGAIDGAFRRCDPSDATIVRALERLAVALYETRWGVRISKSARRAQLELLILPTI